MRALLFFNQYGKYEANQMIHLPYIYTTRPTVILV